jgi:hypothetical protein
MVYLKNPSQQVKRNDLVTARLLENRENGVTGEVLAEVNPYL